MTRYYTKINKIPYLLWFTNAIELDVDMEKMTVDKKNMTSTIKKVSTLQIFFMKYLPILFLLLFTGVLPNSISEIGYFIIGAFITLLVIYVFFEQTKWFKGFIVLSSVFVWYYLLNDGDAFILDRILLYSIELLMFGYIFWEILTDRWDKYYYLENITTDVVIKSERKKRPIFKFGTKEFIKLNTGVNYLNTIKMSGYYISISDEIKRYEEKYND